MNQFAIGAMSSTMKLTNIWKKPHCRGEEMPKTEQPKNHPIKSVVIESYPLSN